MIIVQNHTTSTIHISVRTLEGDRTVALVPDREQYVEKEVFRRAMGMFKRLSESGSISYWEEKEEGEEETDA